MGSGASSTAPAKDSRAPVQLLPTHNVQVPSTCSRLYFGLSWSAGSNIDIDASAVCLAGANVVDIISFQKLRDATPASIVHTGDVLTSGKCTGTSDLERIYVQPEKLAGRGIDNVFLVVNVYTQGQTFNDVKSAYARLVHADSDQELARFNLKGCRGDALVFAKLYYHGDKWNWMGLGQQAQGRTAQDVAQALAKRMVPPPTATPVPAAPPQMLQVLVQSGMPGQYIQVQAPDGVLTVMVPPNAVPGSIILVNTAPPEGQAKPPAGGVKVKATKSSATPALLVASATGVAAAVAIFAAPNLDLSSLGIGAAGLVDAAADLVPQELLEAVPTMDPSDFAEVVGDLAGDVVSESGDVLMSVSGAASNLLSSVPGALSGVGKTVGGVAGDAGRAIAGVAGNLGGVGKAVGGVAGDAGRAIAGAAENFPDVVGGAANAVGGAVGGAANVVGGAANAVGGAANAVGGAVGNVGNVVGTIAEGAGDVFVGLAGFAVSAIGVLSDLG